MLPYLALAALSFASPARVLSESDTGMVFGDLDCEVVSHEASAPTLHEGDWGYLYAFVEIATTCVTADGRQWHQTGSDDVWFPTVGWDAESQSWKQDGVTVATKKDFRTVELSPELDAQVWTSEDEGGVAFKVQIKTKPSLP